MSVNVPQDVLSEVISACQASNLSLIISNQGRTYSCASINYEITESDRVTTLLFGPKAHARFGTKVTLASPPANYSGVVTVTATATNAAETMEKAARSLINISGSRQQAVDNATNAVAQCAAIINDTMDGDPSDTPVFEAAWLSEGPTEVQVTAEAAIKLSQALAQAWNHRELRVPADRLLESLSANMPSRDMQITKDWLNSLAPTGP